MGTYVRQPLLMLLCLATHACSADHLPSRIARLQEEQAPSPAQRRAPGRGIDLLILLDRAVDVVTPCCTQLTYEGLIDEVFGIVNGAVQLEPGGCAGMRLLHSALRCLDVSAPGLLHQIGIANGVRHAA